MLYSYNWLQEYIKEPLPKPKELEELLAMHAFEVEGIEKKGSNWIFDISVLPNRTHDTWNHVGMAREIAAIAKMTLQEPKKRPLKLQKGTLRRLSTTIEAKPLVPRYAAILIEGVEIKQSPAWLRE